jgi:hypothetical protein
MIFDVRVWKEWLLLLLLLLLHLAVVAGWSPPSIEASALILSCSRSRGS